MRVLLVNKFHYLKGGSEKYYFELGRLLKEHGHEVAYFSMKNEKNIKTGDKEYFVEELDLNNGSKLKALDVIYSKENKKKMKEALEDFKPDIVHLNNFQRQLSASIIDAIKEKNIQVVFTAHDMNAICPASAMLYEGKICEECIEKGYMSCIKKSCIKDSKLKSALGIVEKKYYDRKKIYKKIDCIISPSNFIKRQLDKGKLNYSRIEVIHNFVNTTDTNDTKIGDYAFYFGRLSIEKGIMNLVKAISNIENSFLYIAGNGPEKENIEKFISENNLENKIKLLGYLRQEEIREYIKNSRFVVLPSVWYENCPYSILETMEIGKPIIGANIGGIPELIEDGKNGYLYKYDDIDMLTEKLQILFNEQKKVKDFSEESKKLFEKNYNSDIYYDKLLTLYSELIKEKKCLTNF